MIFSINISDSAFSRFRANIKSGKNPLIKNENISNLRFHFYLFFDLEISETKNDNFIIIFNSNNHIIINLFT